jgi:hypothetical protein
LLVVLVVACGGSSLDSTRLDDTARLPGVAGPDVSSDTSAALIEARVVITSTIALDVPAVRDTYFSVGELTRSYGGFVAQARIAEDDNSAASLRLRLPANRHDEFLASLRDLEGAKVRREETDSSEVTAEFTDLESRLRNLQRSEAQYQTLLNRAETIDEVIQVRGRLDDVRGQIEQATGQLNLLSDQTSFATINLTLAAAAAPARSSIAKPLAVFEDAMQAAVVVALVGVNLLVIGLVAAIWLVPAGLVALLAWRFAGRRLRTIGERILSW